MTDQKRLPTPVERTIQRLVNGESRFHKDYLRGFFDGKSAAAILEGIEALRDCWLDGRCNPDHAFELLQIVNDLAVEGAAEGRGFEFSYRDESFRLAMAMLARATMRNDNNIRTIKKIFSEVPGILDSQQRKDAMGKAIAKSVVHTNRWQILVREIGPDVLGWDAAEIKNYTEGDPALVKLFTTHCEVAGRDSLDTGDIGLAAALLTIGGASNRCLSELYGRARAAGQAVSLACVQPINDLRVGPLRDTDTLLAELFGTPTDQRGAQDARHARLAELGSQYLEADKFSMDGNGVVTALYPFYNTIIKKLLVPGRWRDGARLIGPPFLSARGNQLSLGDAALITMTEVERNGDPCYAAALGQIALADHLAVPADKRDTSVGRGANSPINRVVNGILDHRFGRKRSVLESRINSAQYPNGRYREIGSDMFFQQEEVAPLMLPKELEDEWKAFMAMITEERRMLIAYFVKRINDLFGRVIARGERLELHLFD